MGSRWNRLWSGARALAILSLVPAFAGCHEQAAASEGAQAPSGETWLTAEQVRTAQIETAPASEHAVDDAVMTTGRVTFDDLRVAHVYSPVTGRVASVRAALGQRVKRGDILATIASPDIGQWSSDVHKATADYIAAEHDFKRKSELLAVNAVAQAVYESAE
ncbi:MAG TPA: efflux RND transporter periplasmic adaptor subunit, partial [Polyangiaceae bacterium]